ncbi:efflux RND transporter periplasmic adaptor subunit [Aestuariibacter halophilus]|uniref:Efflux RND transporter periplasmic adaptor subunit n=1 Tax=Fluctibacter halophilus TaxID=226011 RepID=A0ABS8G579_9ALTE|nr:efflux RND transporter periplasmic adaptor subunit [Aestuariibacter halophilus]MCC2615030.1 efflux RND transporter periplasmic adaptor subunit [Aestuariibacter halophilus]
MNTLTKSLLMLVAGAAVGAGVTAWLAPASQSGGETDSGSDAPLYWVAPMDPNYRRDKPGKSPMGMDLIPVYEETGSAAKAAAGTVAIDPKVVNNLGVRTAPVSVRPLQTDINTVGYVQYDENNLVHIHPRVDGWVETLYVKAAGDPVSQGEPLYSLYSPTLVNAQEELVIALNRGNQSLITAAKARLSALQLSQDFINRLSRDRVVRQTVTFYALQSGVVDNLQIREGFYVKPGTTLMSIAKLDPIWVEAEVFERDVAQVQAGQPVSMTLDYLPGRVWQGAVDYVYPALDDKTRTLRVRMSFDNADHTLKPNMFAQIALHGERSDSALVVPREAVIRTGSQDRVVVALGDGAFKSVAVTLGRVTANGVEILNGLLPSDTVVTSAQFLIDSESSKTSDFLRMAPRDEQNDDNTATVEGVINRIDADTRMINISRDGIEKWGRPPATMDFVADRHIDLDSLAAGMSVTFTFTVGDEFMISVITPHGVLAPADDEGHDHTAQGEL